jgi:hypothetical protein
METHNKTNIVHTRGDDFGVKYVGKEHAEHLMTVLQEHYQTKADWTGTRYIGIHMAWDYE